MKHRNSHIFDGQTLTKETAAFQLCDIVDPMLKEMIEDPDALRDTCDVRAVIFVYESELRLIRNETVGTQHMRSSRSRPFFDTNSSPSSKDILPLITNVVLCSLLAMDH